LGGEHDHLGLGVDLAQPLEQLDSIHLGEGDVQDRHVEVLLLGPAERLDGRCGLLDVMPAAQEPARDHPPEVIIVVNGQDAEAVVICHGMGLDWLLIVPDLGYAFGPARMGMRLVIGRSMNIGPP